MRTVPIISRRLTSHVPPALPATPRYLAAEEAGALAAQPRATGDRYVARPPFLLAPPGADAGRDGVQVGPATSRTPERSAGAANEAHARFPGLATRAPRQAEPPSGTHPATNGHGRFYLARFATLGREYD